MFKWEKMYWLFLKNKSETIEYIKEHESSIRYAPIIITLLDTGLIEINAIFIQSKIINIILNLLFILCLINVCICNRIIRLNKEILEQQKIQKEGQNLEDKARYILVKVVRLAQQYNCDIDEIDKYYKFYTNKINSAFDNYDLKSIISSLNYKIKYLKEEQEEENNYNIYKNWRKTHYTYTNFNERNWWNTFEKRYQKEFHNGQSNNSNTYSNSNYSEIEKYLRILELPLNTTNLSIIKKQYFKLIKKYHPDVSHDNGEKAKEINIAYQGLKEILN